MEYDQTIYRNSNLDMIHLLSKELNKLLKISYYFIEYVRSQIYSEFISKIIDKQFKIIQLLFFYYYN